MLLKNFCAFLTIFSFFGCAPIYLPEVRPMNGDGSQIFKYGYTPIDPLSIDVGGQIDLKEEKDGILLALPNETIAFASGIVSASGNIDFNGVSTAFTGETAEFVLDYIKYTTVLQTVEQQSFKSGLPRPPGGFMAQNAAPDSVNASKIPVYVGVGMRLRATFRVLGGKINVTDLFSVAAAAEAKQIIGTLLIQQMGIGGKDASAAIQIPSELSRSTIQNAILGIGVIKSKLNDTTDGITISPQVIGIFLDKTLDFNSLSIASTILNCKPKLKKMEYRM